MNRQQIVVVAMSVLVVVLLYQLPIGVVENEVATEVEPHDFSISDEDAQAFSSLKRQLKESAEIKKSVNFADSLAKLSLKYHLLDSAADYAQKILQLDTDQSSKLKAAMIYYQAFQVSGNQVQSVEMATKARKIFEETLESDPHNSLLKNKLAMTLMITENPMAGIQLLREVLAKDPNNREAILNLGLLAIRSGQYDRAEERFRSLLELDSTDTESMFYLGVACSESGKTEEGKQVLEKLMHQRNVDPALKVSVSSYLKDL